MEELLNTRIESVSGASRYQQRVTDAPSSVTVVTAEEIRRYGWRTLADVLQSARGFHVTYDRFYHYAGIRGFARPADYNSRILVLINGHRVNETVYDGAYLESGFPVDLDLVERIEIIRGPGSSLYGTNALFAVLNVQTKRGGHQTEFSLEAASLRTSRVRVTKAAGSLLASATGYVSEGQRSIALPEFAAPLRNVDRDRAGNGFLSWQFGNWTLEGAASIRRKYYPPVLDGQQVSATNNYGEDVRGYGDLSYKRAWGERGTIAARVYFDRYLFDGRNPYAGEGPDETIMGREFANSAWWGGELQLGYQAGRHHVTAGFEARLQPLVRLFTYDEEPYAAQGGSRASLKNGGVFVQDEWTLHKKLHLIAGLRLDGYTSFGRMVNPRVAAVFQPSARSSFKLIYGQAFRAPNPYELNYRTPAFLPNPALVPEKVRAVEAVWEHYWAGGWRSSVSIFRNDIQRVVSQVDVSEAVVQYQNQGHFSGWGAEAELGYQQKNGWDLLLSYGYQPFRDTADGRALPNSPRQLAKARASRPVLRGRLTLAGEGHYYSGRYSAGRQWLPGYFWPSVTLTTRQRTVDVSLSVYNVFDEIILHPVGGEWMTQYLRQNGRGFRAQLRYRPQADPLPADR